MNREKSSSADYIVFVQHTGTGAELPFPDSSVDPMALSNIVKNQFIPASVTPAVVIPRPKWLGSVGVAVEEV